MNTKKLSLIIIFAMIINATLILAEDATINAPTTTFNNDQATKDAVIQESQRTRQEIKSYIDTKIGETTVKFQTEGQKFIDDNFAVMDKRIQYFISQFIIKVTIAIILAIIAGEAIWYMIKKSLGKLETTRPVSLTEEDYTKIRTGIITEEYQTKINKEQNTNYKAPPTPENQEIQPKPPTLERIQKIIDERRAKTILAKKESELQRLEREEAKRTEELKTEEELQEKKKQKNINKKQQDLEKIRTRKKELEEELKPKEEIA